MRAVIPSITFLSRSSPNVFLKKRIHLGLGSILTHLFRPDASFIKVFTLSTTVNNLVQSAPETESEADNIPTGVSMENASYMESNEESSLMSNNVDLNFDVEQNNEEEHTPQLFSN